MPSNRRKILYFATQLYPLASGRASGFGGAETELWNVARRLAQDSNFDVIALCVTDELRQPQQFDGIQLYAVPTGGPLTYGDSWLKRRLHIWKYFIQLYIKARGLDADVYFAKLASSEASTIWLAARAARARYVFRVEHDWETNPDDLSNIIFRGSRFWARTFLFCLKRADLVVVQTEKQAAALKENFGVDSVLIPNGQPMPAQSEIARGFDERKSILWAGRTHPMKRPMLFIDLARRHPGLDFTMIMSPSPEHAGLFSECQKASGEVPNLTFLPGVAPAEMNRYYQQARVFVLTSDAEGFSNVIIESLKNGTPVISLTHNPNNILQAVESQNDISPALGFFTNDDMNATSAVVSALAENRPLWDECHRLAWTTARETFGVEHVAERYKQEFERLMATR